ncbi:MAG: hypothetical protein K2Q18_13610 [Bdellovibrionales bacterium]|nr:hypothetical protein [Bdellovibrionales bacterium]
MVKQLLFLILISSGTSLQASTKFSSLYLDTTTDCSCIEKNLQEGQDCTQFTCKEMLGFQVQTSFDGSACDLGKLKILKDSKELISLNEVPKKIEWRLADNEPIAVIYRLKGLSKSCTDLSGSSKNNEMLMVSGLGKYSAISGQVEAKLKNANEKARQIVDKGISLKAK